MTCQSRNCEREAMVALRTTRPQRDNVMTVIYWEDRAEKVPKKAEHLCTECALHTINELAKVLA
jgi:hypothetical protein